MQQDILFLHPNASDAIYQDLSKEHSGIETPIWCGMLANHVRSRGFSAAILDCEVERLSYVESAKRVKYENPKIVCVVIFGQQPSASSQNMEGAVAFAKEIKAIDPMRKIMFVGGHVAAFPLESLTMNEVDFVAQNEGVYTVSNLLCCDDFEDESLLRKVKGLGWKTKEDHPVLNEINPIVSQELLERDLPGIAWDLLPPPSAYRTAGWHSWSNGSEKSPFISLYSSLGCPFKCFVSGTKVVMHSGEVKPIEQLGLDDALMGFDEELKIISSTIIINLITNYETDCLFKIKFDDGFVECTGEHPFYVNGKWIEARELRIGDEIKSTSGFQKITAITKKELIEPVKVYNVQCSPHENYFVELTGGVSRVLSHNCSFCCINIINRTEQGDNVAADKSATFRYWKPSFIIEEFDKIAKMGVKNVKIADEMFVLREPHFMEVCKLLAERQYGLNLWIYGRIDTVKPHHLETLKKAGVNWLALGIESPDQTVRKDVVKGGYKEVKIIDVIKMIQDAGIAVGANYIFGLPLDTHETMNYTLDFAIDANTENANFYSAAAYAGSPLYLQAKREGWELPDRYSGFSQHSYYTQNLPTNYLTAAEVLKFRDEAWVKYFTSERYLNMLESKYGKPARQDVENSAKIKLKRRLLGD